MPKSPFYSVILPAYNAAAIMQPAVTSVYDQQMATQDFELIIVNDGSTDNTQSEAERIASNHPNARVISQPNKGLGGARNTGIAASQGEYLVFLDADDWLLPGFLSAFRAQLNGQDIAEFGARLVTQTSTKREFVFPDTQTQTGPAYILAQPSINSACNKIYRRDFLQSSNLEFRERIYGEDIEFNTRAFFVARNVTSHSQVGAAFFQSPVSITRGNDDAKTAKYLSDMFNTLERLSQMYRTREDLTQVQRDYWKFRLSTVSTNIFIFAFKKRKSFRWMQEQRSRLKAAGDYYLDTRLNVRSRDLFRQIVHAHPIALQFLTFVRSIL